MKKEDEKKFLSMTSRERRSVIVIALISTFRMFGIFALLPVLSIFAGRLDDATPFLVGVAVGAYGLTQAIMQIPLGLLSDYVGRVPVILGGLIIFFVGSVVAAESETIIGVIGGRLLQGVGAISSALTALLSDATRKEVRTRSMAFFGIGIGFSFLIALIIGPIIAADGGVRSLFWLSAIVAIIAGVMLFLLPSGIKQSKPYMSFQVSSILRPPLLRIDIYMFLLHTLLTSIFVSLPYMLVNNLQISIADHSRIYVISILLSLLGTIPLIIIDDRRGKDATIFFALILLFLGQLFLIITESSIVMAYFGLTIFFAGFNFLEAGLPAKLSILADEKYRGASLGVFSSFQFLGTFFGGLIGGWLLIENKPENVFICTLIITAIWIFYHKYFSNLEN